MMLPQKAAFTYLSLNRPRPSIPDSKKRKVELFGEDDDESSSVWKECGRNVEGIIQISRDLRLPLKPQQHNFLSIILL